ncbi:unnamed protein product [Darwinula stevensoni]|uniref:Beta-galactosidase n=1 Tax=Darwinula stevensoni TaxID=69355 RepID=A0A7R8XDC0_9CRUS|nr:unnamed protein product [Darwinula stevensoni]CAG0894562.1 unnamed protein product [Darwinula stevensoni]
MRVLNRPARKSHYGALEASAEPAESLRNQSYSKTSNSEEAGCGQTRLARHDLRVGSVKLSRAIEFRVTGVRCQNTSLYDWYSAEGITASLKADGKYFTLNNQKILILSGAIHYYRVHPEYWRDRLLKLKALGLNTVETYVPWNLHQPMLDTYDFGTGTDHMSQFLNITNFLEIAQELGLFVILRLGPYICSEWEFGGLPSYLLETQEKLRISDEKFLKIVQDFLDALFLTVPLVKDFVWRNGSTPYPIIAVQVENEYGRFGYGLPDTVYLSTILAKFKSKFENEDLLFFTSDTPSISGTLGAIPEVLMTAKIQNNSGAELDELMRLQPDRPLMAAEFWTGWFDHWLESHQVRDTKWFSEELSEILRRNASVNFYMFHGGTNFGFMNGANVFDHWPYYAPDVTSNDFGALLSEAGDYTDKYEVAASIINTFYSKVDELPPLQQLESHERPPETNKTAYGNVPMTHFMKFQDIILVVGKANEPSIPEKPWPSMEELRIKPIDETKFRGQRYGFILYQLEDKPEPGVVLRASGKIKDMAYVLVDDIVVNPPYSLPEDLKKFGFWATREADFVIPQEGTHLAVMVENLGRNNFGKPHDFEQRKGLPDGPLKFNGAEAKIDNSKIFALEFTKKDLEE